MDRDTSGRRTPGARASGATGAGTPDTRENIERARRVRENRDALAAQARRVAATVPPELRAAPALGATDGAGPSPTEDTTEAVRHSRAAAENRAALEAQARRVDATTPPEIPRGPKRVGRAP